MNKDNNSNNINVYNIKIILLGEVGTGKTNLIATYFDGRFNENCPPTINPRACHTKLEIENNLCFVDMWDTMGHEKYRAITTSFIKGSNIIVFVYDITRKETFLALEYWVEQAKEIVGNENIMFAIAANKIDLIEFSQIEKSEGLEFAKKIGAYFIESSSKANPEGFKKFINKLLTKMILNNNILEKEGTIQSLHNNSNNIKLKHFDKKANSKKKCC